MTLQLKKIFLYLLPLGFIPYILICFYNNPNADDFIFGAMGRNGNLFNTWLDQYKLIGGRYSSNFWVLVGPLSFGSFLMYKFVPLLLLVCHWFSMKFFLKSLTEKFISTTELNICTYVMVFLFIYQMPVISEGLYWYSGAVTYFLGCIFTTVYLGLLIRFWQRKFLGKSKFIHLVIVTAFIFISIGFNEVLMIMMNIFAIVLLLALIRHELPNKAIAVYLIVVTLTASCLVFLAPGNTVRNAQYPHQHDFYYSLFMSILQTFRFFFTWVLSGPLWILSFAYYYLHNRLLRDVKLFRESFYLNVYTSTNLLFIVIFVSVFPAYWATGILGQHRTLNVAYFFFIILWFINLTVWFNWAEMELVKVREPNKIIVVSLFVVLMGCFLWMKNGYYTTTDITSGRAAHFDSEMHKRYTLMKSDADTLVFSPIKNPPRSLSFYEVTSNPNDWLNACWVSYFDREGDVVVVRKN